MKKSNESKERRVFDIIQEIKELGSRADEVRGFGPCDEEYQTFVNLRASMKDKVIEIDRKGLTGLANALCRKYNIRIIRDFAYNIGEKL